MWTLWKHCAPMALAYGRDGLRLKLIQVANAFR